MILADADAAEGVYMASGSSGSGTIKCESIYMNGVWQAQAGSSITWSSSTGYKEAFGCLGCRANRSNGCGLLTDYVESGYASSYESDIGYLKPTWERKGYLPDQSVYDTNDWDVG